MTTKTKLKPLENSQPYLTFRDEGDGFLNAYATKTDTLLGAVLLGCIPKAVAGHNRELRTAWMFFMRQVMREYLDIQAAEPPLKKNLLSVRPELRSVK